MFKKKLISAAAVALLASSAFAQMNTPPVAKPAAEAAAQPAPAPSAAPVAEAPSKADVINPFMGKTLSLEARQRELETAKMETALLEERIKQAALSEDLKTLPLKKSVEAAQATTARMKEEAMQKDGGKAGPTGAVTTAVAAPAAAAPASTPAKPKTRPAKKVEAKEDVQKDKPVAQAAPIAPKIEVTSVMSLGGVRSAVLELDGNILTAKHGDSTPFGMVEVLDSQSVRVGGRVYKVHGSTLARITISDPKPVDPKAVGATTPAPVPVTSGPTSVPPQATFPSNQPSRVGSPALPPLQLPSGVTIIPPTSR